MEAPGLDDAAAGPSTEGNNVADRDPTLQKLLAYDRELMESCRQRSKGAANYKNKKVADAANPKAKPKKGKHTACRVKEWTSSETESETSEDENERHVVARIERSWPGVEGKCHSHKYV